MFFTSTDRDLTYYPVMVDRKISAEHLQSSNESIKNKNKAKKNTTAARKGNVYFEVYIFI